MVNIDKFWICKTVNLILTSVYDKLQKHKRKLKKKVHNKLENYDLIKEACFMYTIN